MKSTKNVPGKPSLALQAAALQQHNALSLKTGLGLGIRSVGGIIKKKLPQTVGPKSSNDAQSKIPLETLRDFSSPWECEGCGRLDFGGSTQCKLCGGKRVPSVLGSGSSTAEKCTLAQRLGLVEQSNDGPPSFEEWNDLEVKVSERVFKDRALTCPICCSSCGLRDCVLTSCSHIFHAACLRSMEHFTTGSGGKGRSCPLCRAVDYYTRPTRLPSLLHVQNAAVTLQRLLRGWLVRSRIFSVHWKSLHTSGASDSSLPNNSRLSRAFLSRALRKAVAGEVGITVEAQMKETRDALESADAALEASAASGRAAGATLSALLERRGRGISGSASKGSTSGGSHASGTKGPLKGVVDSKKCGISISSLQVQTFVPHSQQLAILKGISDRLLALQSSRNELTGVRDTLTAAALGAKIELNRSSQGGIVHSTFVQPCAAAFHSGAAASAPPACLDWTAIHQASIAFFGGEGSSEDCCVCLSPLLWQEDIGCALLSCSHRVHTACLDALEAVCTLRGGEKRCPLCRVQYVRFAGAPFWFEKEKII